MKVEESSQANLVFTINIYVVFTTRNEQIKHYKSAFIDNLIRVYTGTWYLWMVLADAVTKHMVSLSGIQVTLT